MTKPESMTKLEGPSSGGWWLRFGKLQALFVLILSGCSLIAPKETLSESAPSPAAVVTANGASVTDQGYAMLFDLLGDERNVSKIRFIKRPRPQVTELLKEISRTSSDAYKQLEQFGKADRSLNLVEKRLPTVEAQTRKAIGQTKEKTLLSSKGKELDLQLLLTQDEAMNYGAHLAKVTATGESDPQRQQFLQQLATQLSQLREKVVALLREHYVITEQ